MIWLTVCDKKYCIEKRNISILPCLMLRWLRNNSYLQAVFPLQACRTTSIKGQGLVHDGNLFSK